MRKEEFLLLVQKYLDGKASEEEKQLLYEWYDSFDDAEVHVPAGEGESETVLGEQMLAQFRQSIGNNPPAKSSKTFVLKRRFGWMGVAAILLILFAGAYFFIQKNKTGNQLLAGRDESAFEAEDEEYDGPDKAIEFEIERTKNPFTGKVPWQQLRIAMEQTELAKEQLRHNRTESTQALAWIERGPNGDYSRINGNSRPNDDQTSGRIRAVMVDSLDPTHKTVFAGSVAGGLWKTTDITAFPATWTLVNDFLSNLAIAAICQDPRPGFRNIMYMCTGESYSNADAVRGVGVFKSIDAGVTWSFLPSSSSFLNGTRILCDHLGNVYLGTRSTGLQRSTDGGTSWTNITPSGLNGDICDLEISSTAVTGRLHVTTGIFTASGYRYTDNPSTVTSAAGWNSATTPYTSFTNRTEIAVSGNTLYALPCNNNPTNMVPTIWKTSDGGDNWAAIPVQPGGGTWANGQGWYDLSCGINPSNSNECIVGGLECYKTTTGGTTAWTKIAVWVGSSGQYIHADQHDVHWWDGGNKLMFACDGGIHFSSDGGTTVRDRNKGLRIKQFYSVAIHPTEINNFIAGAQDNGMHRLNHVGLDSSIEFYGGDGMYAAIDQDEPQFQFGAAFNNNIRRSVNGGLSWGNVGFANGRFVSPWDYDNTGNIMYICNLAGSYLRWNNPQGGAVSSNVVSVAEFGGGNVSAVHVSPYTANRVFFGMGSGGIIRVDNAHLGTTATGVIITPAGAAGYANCVVTGSSDQNLMATYSSYGVNQVYVSSNGGTSWTACDGNLPDMPVRWALFHPDSDTKAYIATETGVWETDLLNGGSTVWVPNTSFPNVCTHMIKYRALDRTIAAGTHGRGLWTATIPAAGGFTFNSPAPATATCPAPAFMDIVLGTNAVGGFSNPITVSSSTPPAGTVVSFIPSNTVTPGNNVTVRLTGTNTLTAGSYVLTITGIASGSPTQTRDITYTITAGSGPAITSHPSNQTICAGGNTSFSIISAGATTFQWQVSTDGGGSYNNIPVGAPYTGTTLPTLTITGATAAMDGYRYRCIASTQCGSTTSNAAILTVNTAPAITSHPANASVCTGTNNTFSVTATGSNLTYQWQLSTNGCAGPWNNIVGATSSSYTLTGITIGQNNTGYRCVVSGTCAPAATSNCALLTVVSSVTISSQPADQTVCEGSNASFTVMANGTPTYQWQVSTDGGGSYNNIPVGAPYSGITSATLTITGATASLNGNRYRCVLTSPCGSPTSNSALLTVNTLPTITSHPSDATLCSGSNNTFSVTATGTNLTYQWQLSTNGCSGPWNNIAGATSSSYTLTGITVGQNNTGYRCVVSGTCAPAATSNCALLTVVSSVTITSQPADQTVCAGSNASFTVAGSGPGIIYQWQVSTDGGVNYTNVTNSGVYSGATSATLTITGATFSLNNNRYRAQLSNATCPTPGISNAAILTVNTLPLISSNPTDATICLGSNTSFSVTASGTGISYQWQLSTSGCAGPWVNLVNGAPYSGVTTATLTITGATAAMSGYGYRVIISGTCAPAAISNCALLTVISPVAITTQPANAEGCSGSNASFTVAGSGSGIIYQWQVSTDGGVNWTNITGANASTYTITGLTVLMNGNRYRALLSNPTCSTPTVSNAATLTVRQLPTVGLTAAPLTSLLPGQTTTLTATPSASTGGTLTTTWYRDAATFTNTGNTYVVDITKLGAYQVKIQEAFAGGLTCFNESPVVIISAAVSSRLFIFPSPNDGRFTVSYYNNGGVGTSRTVTVYDSKGAKVYNAKFPVVGPYTLLSIDIRPAQRGIYYVVVGDANGKKLAEGKMIVHW